MIKLDDQFYKYQALAALAAAANYTNFMTTNIGKRGDDDDLDEPKNKRFKHEEQYSDIESDEEIDKKETEEEIDVGSHEVSDDEKLEKSTRKSSFFISDILGLDTPKPEAKTPSLFDQILHNYQQQLQRTFDIYRLFSTSQTHETSAKEENKREETSGSASILSSLEKLAKGQLTDAPMTPSEILNSPKAKKIDSSKKVDIQIKKQEESPKEPELQTEKKADANLFPAWVYCTRYSDRPSAGWFFFSISIWTLY